MRRASWLVTSALGAVALLGASLFTLAANAAPNASDLCSVMPTSASVLDLRMPKEEVCSARQRDSDTQSLDMIVYTLTRAKGFYAGIDSVANGSTNQGLVYANKRSIAAPTSANAFEVELHNQDKQVMQWEIHWKRGNYEAAVVIFGGVPNSPRINATAKARAQVLAQEIDNNLKQALGTGAGGNTAAVQPTTRPATTGSSGSSAPSSNPEKDLQEGLKNINNPDAAKMIDDILFKNRGDYQASGKEMELTHGWLGSTGSTAYDNCIRDKACNRAMVQVMIWDRLGEVSDFKTDRKIFPTMADPRLRAVALNLATKAKTDPDALLTLERLTALVAGLNSK